MRKERGLVPFQPGHPVKLFDKTLDVGRGRRARRPWGSVVLVAESTCSRPLAQFDGGCGD